jgi:hypothetical protein
MFRALVLAGVLFLSPLAMAGELGSADSNFLFSSDQVAVTTISDQEMDSTQGQVISSLVSLLGPVTSTVESLPVVGPTVSSMLNTVFGLLP